jgi:UDP-GlcNAc:undecaprenyl-phosphate GlcNAc-1-phosphate transferase
MDNLILPLVVALTTSTGLTVVVRRLAVRCNVMDHPDGQRKLHPTATSLWGGVGVFRAIVLGTISAGSEVFATTSSGQSLAFLVLLVAGGLCVLGAVDDCRILKSRSKLLLQVVTLLVLVSLGYHFDRVSLLGGTISLGWLGYPIALIWLLGCINAFNLLDGTDGLVASIGLAASLLIVVVALTNGHTNVAIMAVVLAGATAGFLIHNRPPAKIFLGDSGSMVLGLMVGILSAEAAVAPQGELMLVFPAVLMCLPLLDSLLALVRRKLSGKPFDMPDREHIHHRLLQRGLSPWQVLAVITGLFVIMGAAAIAAMWSGHRAIGWTTAVTLVAWLIRARWFGHHEWDLVAAVLRRWSHRAVACLRSWLTRPSCQDDPDQRHGDKEKKPLRRRAA